MREITFQSYRQGDEAAIIELADVVYPHLNLDLDGWNWRYRDNPAGHALIELAWDGDLLVGHYAVCPVLLHTGSRESLTYLSLLTMVHPDHRGQKLFQKLAERTYRRAIRMVWGFPNRHAHRGFVRDLGWLDVYEIPMMRMALHGYCPQVTPCANVIEVQEFDDRFDALWQRKCTSYRFMVRRDCSYLQWRYVHNSMESYRILAYTTDDNQKILGYVVIKRYKGEYQIVDLLVLSIAVGVRLVQSVILMAIQNNIPSKSISLWLNVSDPLHHELEKMGFHNGAPITYFAAKSFSPWQRVPGFYDWYVTMGDSDVF